MRIAATLLILSGIAWAQESLAPELQPFKRLFGSSWLLKSSENRFPERMFVDPGATGGHVRFRSYKARRGDDFLLDETYVFWHPGEQKLRTLKFFKGGAVAWGSAATEPETIRLDRPTVGLRDEYFFGNRKKGAFTRMTSLVIKDLSVPQTHADGRREKTGPGQGSVRNRNKSAQLAPVARLIGRWDTNGKGFTGRHEYSWTASGRAIASKTFMRRGEEAERLLFFGLHYWDPAQESIAILLLRKGRVSLGTLKVDGDKWAYAWTTHAAKGATKVREAMHFPDKDTHVCAIEVARDGKWVPVGETTNKRDTQAKD